MDVAVDFAYEVAKDTTKEALRARIAAGATVIRMPLHIPFVILRTQYIKRPLDDFKGCA